MSQLDLVGAYSYCSQGNVTWREQPISEEEGVQAIVAILAKQVLCRHDVENINRFYRTIKTQSTNKQVRGVLKKKIEELHQESLKVQNGVYQEVNRLGSQLLRQVNWNQILKNAHETQNSQSDYAASALVSFYQLQKLERVGPILSQQFLEGQASFWEKNEQQMDMLAALIPCCHSGPLFEEDRRALLGSSPKISTCEIADRSLNQMLEADFLRKEIDFKLSQLSREPHPAYFAQLLQKGFLTLFNYLKEMQKLQEDTSGQQDYIDAMPFSQVSQVILETRDAIMQCVEEAVNSSPAKQVVFLVGLTGTGKSTAFCYLRGDKMERIGDQFQSQQDPNLIFEGNQSGTFFPNTALVDDILLVDFPGFEDTNGPCVALGIEMALKTLVRRYPAKLLVLGEVIAVDVGRANAFDILRMRLARLFQDSTHCVIGITKYLLENDFKEIAHQKEMIKREEERLLELNTEETKLQNSVGAVEEAYRLTKNPALESILSDQKSRLQELQKAKSKVVLLIQECKKKIAEREPLLRKSEATLLSRLGRSPENSQVIRLEDVSDPQAREGHLAILREAHIITAEETNSMDAKHLEYLQKRFRKQLVPELQSTHSEGLSNGAAAFQTYVLTTSLINALTLTTHPQIGRFLHAPEVSSDLVDGFDREIVQSCSDQLIEQIVLDLDLPAYQLLLKDRDVSKEVDEGKRKTVQALVDDLSKIIVFLKADGPAQSTEDAFKRVRERYVASKKLKATQNEDSALTDPRRFSWMRHFVGVAIDFVSSFFDVKKASNPFFDELIIQLRQAQHAISSLRELGVLVDKRKEIALVLQSWTEIDWQEAYWKTIIRNKIDVLEKVYGSEKWKARVKDLRLHCPQYGPKQKLHLLGAISMLPNNHIRFVTIENDKIIPALEAKAKQHHYSFMVRREESGTLILVDHHYYPLLIFGILLESLKNDTRRAQQLAKGTKDEPPILVQLVQVCTGKSIEMNNTADNIQLVFSRIDDVLQQLANTIHAEISVGQNTTAVSMTAAMMYLVAFTRMKLEQDSLEKFLTELSGTSLYNIVSTGVSVAGGLGVTATSIKTFLTLGTLYTGGLAAIPWVIGAFLLQNVANASFAETVEILKNPERKLGLLLLELTQLMDMSIFFEITQFAREFLQMDVDMPLFSALLVDVYSEQAGLKKS